MVSRLQKKTGTPDLAKSLEDVTRVYELKEARPNAKRVLVVILDNKSNNTVTQLKTIVTDLVQRNILIIGVGIGRSVDPDQLKIITEENRNIIQVGRSENPDELVKRIMAIILRSTFYYFPSYCVS